MLKDKYVVAAIGMVCATALCIANLVWKGPDATVTAAVIGAITFIAGLAFGYKKS